MTALGAQADESKPFMAFLSLALPEEDAQGAAPFGLQQLAPEASARAAIFSVRSVGGALDNIFHLVFDGDELRESPFADHRAP